MTIRASAWRNALIGLSSVAIAAPVCGAADVETTPNVDEAEKRSYLRVTDVPGESLRLEIASRGFVPAGHSGGDSAGDSDGANGPRIELVGVAHIGDAVFYQALERHLAQFDVVLYESVMPAGTASPPRDADDAELRAHTQAAMAFVAGVIEAHRKQRGTYPRTLEELATFAAANDDRLGGWVAGAAVDGWGTDLVYDLSDERGYVLTSLGADKKPGGDELAADISRDAADPAPPVMALSDGDGIQGELARALGLSFQLSAMDYSADNWQCSDMAMDELERAMAAKGADFAPVGGTLAGSSLSAQFAKVLLRLVGVFDAMLEGRVSDMAKIMLIEVLGDEQLIDTSLNQFGAGFTEVIIDDRNQIVVDDLRELIAARPDLESVAVFYGAGHMADLEQRLAEQLSYVPADEPGQWFSAIELDMEQTRIDPVMVRQMRSMMRNAVRQQMRMMEQMKNQ